MLWITPPILNIYHIILAVDIISYQDDTMHSVQLAAEYGVLRFTNF